MDPRPRRRLSAPRRRRTVGLLTVAAVVTGLVAATTALAPSAQAVQTYVLPPTGSVTVVGHGNGHGHGLSQYGARGAAMAGLTAAKIIAFYYPGTKLVTLKSSSVRVLLSGTGSTATVVASPGLRVGTVGALPTTGIDAYRLVAVSGASTLRLDKRVKSVWSTVRSGLPNGTAFSRPPAATLRVLRSDNTSTVYHGTITAFRGGSGVISVNTLALDDYTAGVVPREMPASWEAAAVQAQAIAARSYARQAVENGAGKQYDICDTSQCQVYGGKIHYDSALNTLWTDDPAALSGNNNQVAQYNGKTIFAQFSASNGGWTAAGGQPYLVAKQDPYDNTKTGDPYLNWTRTAAVGDVASYFGLKRVTNIQVTSRDGNGQWGGRVLAGYVNGVDSANATQRISVSGFDLQDALGLPHNWFTIEASNQAPRGHLDRVDITASRTFTVYGWTFDPNHPDQPGQVSLTVDGKGGAVQQTNGSRPDVQRVYGLLTSTVGFSIAVKVAPGSHTLCAVGHDLDSSATVQFGCRTVTMSDQIGAADSIAAGHQSVHVVGWILDPDHLNLPGQYQVVLDGTAGATRTTTNSRPDVQRIYHTTIDTLGYDVSVSAAAGSHKVCVQALDRDGGGPVTVRCAAVTVD